MYAGLFRKTPYDALDGLALHPFIALTKKNPVGLKKVLLMFSTADLLNRLYYIVQAEAKTQYAALDRQ